MSTQITNFFRSWWLIPFLLFCAIAYERGRWHQTQEFEKLEAMEKRLHEEQKHEEERLKSLTLQLQSRSDPAWIELKLMEKLGLIPQNAKKFVVIRKKDDL